MNLANLHGGEVMGNLKPHKDSGIINIIKLAECSVCHNDTLYLVFPAGWEKKQHEVLGSAWFCPGCREDKG